MNIVEIISTKYNEDWILNKISFKDFNDGQGLVLDKWEMPIPKPTNNEILALDTPALENQFALNNFFKSFSPIIQEYIDAIASKRGYKNALSCLSYLNSTNDKWKNDASTFNNWRDSVWAYIDSQQTLIINGSRSIPLDLSNLMQELPLITWSS